jgi:hypothetical protein
MKVPPSEGEEDFLRHANQMADYYKRPGYPEKIIKPQIKRITDIYKAELLKIKLPKC